MGRFSTLNRNYVGIKTHFVEELTMGKCDCVELVQCGLSVIKCWRRTVSEGWRNLVIWLTYAMKNTKTPKKGFWFNLYTILRCWLDATLEAAKRNDADVAYHHSTIEIPKVSLKHGQCFPTHVEKRFSFKCFKLIRRQLLPALLI